MCRASWNYSCLPSHRLAARPSSVTVLPVVAMSLGFEGKGCARNPTRARVLSQHGVGIDFLTGLMRQLTRLLPASGSWKPGVAERGCAFPRTQQSVSRAGRIVTFTPLLRGHFLLARIIPRYDDRLWEGEETPLPELCLLGGQTESSPGHGVGGRLEHKEKRDSAPWRGHVEEPPAPRMMTCTQPSPSQHAPPPQQQALWTPSPRARMRGRQERCPGCRIPRGAHPQVPTCTRTALGARTFQLGWKELGPWPGFLSCLC